MNSEKEVYQELGDSICLQPFFGAFYQTVNVVDNVDQTSNIVRPCCFINDSTGKWDIKDDSIHLSRNSDAWKQMRQDFLDGNFYSIPDCSTCQNNEKIGAVSARQSVTKYLCDTLDVDIVEKVKSIAVNNVVDDIVTLDFFPSNYCNLSCIMCVGGASSSRHVFELKFRNRNTKILLNKFDKDFLQSLEKLQVINFTGGETVIQPQVLEVIDYLIEKNLAKNITVKLLTNLTKGPGALEKRLEKFKSVNVTISVDGTEGVIEYQRRGCHWDIIDTHAREYINHKKIGVVVNYVLTAVNVLSAVDFIDWIYSTGFGPTHADHKKNTYVIVTPVADADHLGQGAVPEELRSVALLRLHQAKQKYVKLDSILGNYYVDLIQQIINLIQLTQYDITLTNQFIQHIKHEDRASTVPLSKIVPEWEPYFAFGRL